MQHERNPSGAAAHPLRLNAWRASEAEAGICQLEQPRVSRGLRSLILRPVLSPPLVATLRQEDMLLPARHERQLHVRLGLLEPPEIEVTDGQA